MCFLDRLHPDLNEGGRKSFLAWSTNKLKGWRGAVAAAV